MDVDVDEVTKDIPPVPKGYRPFNPQIYVGHVLDALLIVKARLKKQGWDLEIGYSDDGVRPYDETIMTPASDLSKEEWIYWQGKGPMILSSIYQRLNIFRSVFVMSLLCMDPKPKEVKRIVTQGKAGKDVRNVNR